MSDSAIGRPREINAYWGEMKDAEGRMVRWTKREALLDGFRSGLSVHKACEYAGISETTFYAEQDRDPDFAEQIARARVRSHAQALKLIQRASNNDWRAAQAFLQMADPDEYGNRLNLRSEHRTEIIQTVLVAVKEAAELVIPDPTIRLRLAEAIGRGIAASLGGPGDAEVRALPPHTDDTDSTEPGGLGGGGFEGPLEAS